VAERRSQLVLGLDPDPERLWPQALQTTGGSGGPAADRAALAVAVHCVLVMDAVAEHCVAVKLQVACFERLGAPGWAALQEVAGRARERGLLVIADAKRGDIDISAAAYGQAFFGETPTPYGAVAGLGADALTVNPLLGEDSLEPLAQSAREHRGGLFVLVRTSNPGAATLQDQQLAEGGSVSDAIAGVVDRLGRGGVGTSALSDVGAVVGATAPEHLARLREQMPNAIFLIPGVGAQGGVIADLEPAFEPGPAGGLVTVSRGIVRAHESTGEDHAGGAAHEAERLRELAWRVAG
jgi:orotidine-5'-phosphate decarboxylase